MTPPDLIAITDDSLEDLELEARVAKLLAAVPRGSTAIQLRDRRRSARVLLTLAERLRQITTDLGAPLIVNDRIDVAVAVRADGVHLGGRSSGVVDARAIAGQETFISVAAHEVSDVEAAGRDGANAALVSPIFASPGKGAPRGVSFLADACARRGAVFVYALGGIDLARTAASVASGAHGVAAIGCVFGPRDAGPIARDIVAAVRAHRVCR